MLLALSKGPEGDDERYFGEGHGGQPERPLKNSLPFHPLGIASVGRVMDTAENGRSCIYILSEPEDCPSLPIDDGGSSL